MPGPPLVAVERRDLAVDPRPVDLAAELHQLVLHVDDLVEPGPEQIAFPRRLVLLRPHRVLRCGNRITARRPEGIPKRNRKVLRPSDRQTLQSKTCCCAENRFAFNRLAVVHGRLINLLQDQSDLLLGKLRNFHGPSLLSQPERL